MQLIGTNIHSGADTTTVEFVGEGGEKVSVCMAAYDMPKDAAITRPSGWPENAVMAAAAAAMVIYR